MRPGYQDEPQSGPCVCVLGCIIRLRARHRQDIRWPFNYSSGGEGRQRTQMTDGSYDSAYQGLVIRSTLRALLANNRSPRPRLEGG